jgi:multidrug resistance efflux pump
MKSWSFISTAAIGVAFALFMLSGKSRVQAQEGTPLLTEQGGVQGVGYVEPASEIRRLMFNADGVIEKCYVKIGDVLKQGQPIMSLQNEEQQANVVVAEKLLAQAQAERAKVFSGINTFMIAAAQKKLEMRLDEEAFADKEHARNQQLIDSHSVSSSEFDKTSMEQKQTRDAVENAKAELENLKNYVTDEDKKLADAKVDLAQAQLDLAKQRLQNTILTAPCDGTVLEIIEREGGGAFSITGEPVVIFGDVSKLRVRAEIDERYISTLKVGQQVIVSGHGLGTQTFQGKIAMIKQIMGKRTVFSHASTERKDLDVLQVMVDMPTNFVAPVGLEVDVKIAIQ